ncbi:hypothetical protein Q3V23_07140 [Streptomyces sp. VNUA116]|uniref:hypothetical protein n=1 Tax=Streptomyces sp. VNUA116 TaxID=3062449 RepID=UPI0026757E52|nr:hypothetical protein [Streptomyces sp. VNUA116]WKU43879.1 hypothetical protein Q3V23_07140 [Streptomyces sp. VNUA116]
MNLEKLSSAVGAWGKLPERVHDVGETFRTQVAKGLQESDWQGESAQAASTAITGLSFQLANAEQEAHSVHDFLNNCLESIRSAKKALHDIATELAGHEHLSLNADDGSVRVDTEKVKPDDLERLRKAYEPSIRSYKERTHQALEDARETDETLSWALRSMKQSYDIGFLPTAPTSLADARRMRREEGRESDKKISLKLLSDQEIAYKMQHASDGKFGNGTIKPAAEFLGYRSWMNSADGIQKRDWESAKTYFVCGTPAYAAGMEAWLMETSGGGGRHRKPTMMNKAGKFGGKAFGFPAAAVVATGLGFSYTPAMPASERPDAKIMAPKDPGQALEVRRGSMQQRNTPARPGGDPPVSHVLFGNHRTLIMGILGTLAGVVGSVGGFSAGAGILEILGFIGIGALGLALAVGYVVVASRAGASRAGASTRPPRSRR